jgi:hypothetical protein
LPLIMELGGGQIIWQVRSNNLASYNRELLFQSPSVRTIIGLFSTRFWEV